MVWIRFFCLYLEDLSVHSVTSTVCITSFLLYSLHFKVMLPVTDVVL